MNGLPGFNWLKDLTFKNVISYLKSSYEWVFIGVLDYYYYFDHINFGSAVMSEDKFLDVIPGIARAEGRDVMLVISEIVKEEKE